MSSDDDDDALPTPPPKPNKPLPFSRMMDSRQCNSRCISKSTIDRIIATDHQNRKKIQDSKMRNIPATCLKIDFHYKLPDKVKVYTGKGKCFSPFKCGVTIQNEDSLTTFWKFLPCAESFEAIKPDLLRLKERQSHIQDKPSTCAWVDNCCTVRDKLQSIFPGILVKLDTFHWFMRWDDILANKTSEEANFFRHLLRRAIFVVEDQECARVKYMKPGMSQYEMHKCTKATMPPAEILIKRVQCALNHIYMRDHETDTQSNHNATDQPVRKRHLKHFDAYVKKGARPVKIRQLINNQLEHVEKGCLSDPPSDIVKIHTKQQRVTDL